MANGTGMLLGLAGVGIGAGIVYLALRDKEESEEPVNRLPGNRRVPGTRRPAPRFPPPVSQVPDATAALPPVPPSGWPIPGGTFIEGVGYCPPGYAYDLSTGMCEWDMPLPQQSVLTTGHQTGACCVSCAAGGECEGCNNNG